MELENFINDIEKPWAYNFERECGDKEFLKLETFQRYLTYKALPNGAYSIYKKANEFINSLLKYSTVYDPDGSGYTYHDLTHKIYNKLWNWEKGADTFGSIDNCPFTDKRIKFGGDTMNSVQSAFNELYKSKGSYLPQPMNKRKVCQNFMIEKMQTENDFCGLLTNCFKNDGLIEYIESYHTLGNFVLVPSGFNGDRSRRFRDYWDFSLNELQTNGFKSFHVNDFTLYINYFFLWDYVEVDEKDEYKIKYIGMENNERNLPTFFQEIVKIIERRGKFMTAMLIIAQKIPHLYTEIQKDLLIDKKAIKGIQDAAQIVLDYKEKEWQGADEKKEKAVKLLEELKHD